MAAEPLPFRVNPWPGRLLVVEGTSRAGKSTLVGRALALAGQPDVVSVSWNSHPYTHPTTTALKHAQLLDPLSFSLAHLLDFSLTYQQVVVPALREGRTVLADRYLHTAWVRDRLRGVPEEFLRAAVSAFVRPHQVFYVEAEADEMRRRYRADRGKYGWYGTGRDRPGAPDDPEESFLAYQLDQMELYRQLAVTESFTVLTEPGPLAHWLRGGS